MPKGRTTPLPYSPAHQCPACGTEAAKPRYHDRPLLPFGSEPHWPCASPGVSARIGDHLCCRCESCGYSWMENALPGGG